MASLLASPAVTARCGGAAVRRRAACAAACRAPAPAAASVASSPALRGAQQLRTGAAPRLATAPRATRRAPRSRVAGARAEAAAAADGKAAAAPTETLYLGLLFGMWYAANIFFNIWNKQVLKAYTFPITGTFVQFGVGLCIASAMWLFRLKEAPKARAPRCAAAHGPLDARKAAPHGAASPRRRAAGAAVGQSPFL
jgi:hypothetical protein